ncbi:stage III sporulation protein AB [bacterium]|nr:stage III sporulation protein AB [bacterium]
MVIIKFLLLSSVFGTISLIGVKIASRYSVRAFNLKQIKKALNMFESKILYSNETIPNVFLDISKRIGGDVGRLFFEMSQRMQLEFAGEAWENCIDESSLILTDEDKDALKTLGKLLGTTDLDGQIKQLSLVNVFLDEQIKESIEQKNKNEKMYKKLGIIVGLAVVIILV